MFDRHVVVDWSANSTPKCGPDSVWIAVRDERGQSVTNLPTRSAAMAFLVDLVVSEPAASMLLGVDFSLGYPAGTADALGLEGAAWSATWELLTALISDDDRNANNRFAVAADLNGRITGAASPFWGCPRSRVNDRLTSTKPTRSSGLGTWRSVEEVLRSQGRRPFSSWQLTGAGAVGSQSLLGIPRLQRFRRLLGDRVEVWPFTTGLRAPDVAPGLIVVAEVWPSIVPVDPAEGTVRDAAQVVGTARWLADHDRDGRIAPLFEPKLERRTAEAVVAEEGWVLGVVA